MSVFTPCKCPAHYLKRVERTPWMRLLPWLKAYQCAHCGKLQLRSESEVVRIRLQQASRPSSTGKRDR